jgi:hypothetical protein
MRGVSKSFWLASAGVLALACVAAGPARADMRSFHGSNLTLTLTTDEDTQIETDTGLSHEVRVAADNSGCLDAGEHGGGEVTISSAPCGSDSGKLTVMVPPGFPVTLMIAGSGNVHAGDLMGPLKATLTSDGDLSVEHAGILQLAVRGSGDVTLRSVTGAADIDVSGSGTVKLFHMEGPLKYSQHGSGDLAIAHIDSPAAQFEGAGSGDAVIAGGHIAALHVRVYGSGDFAMDGTVDTADLEATGGGDIRIPQATGLVTRHANGGSDITVGGGNGLASSAMKRLSQSLAGNDDDGVDSDTVREVITGQHSSEGGTVVHVLAGLLVLGLLVALWRTIARNGGMARLTGRGRRYAAGEAPAPRHPGVLAVCDKLAELEKRLARVEIHVTSREFDLNRKFREIDAGGR